MDIDIKIEIIDQLKDNYAYLLYSKKNNKAIVFDPAEADSIINFLNLNNLSLEGILVTHHHADHTSGIKNLLNYKKTKVFSPSEKIDNTTNVIKNNSIINFDFINFTVFASPGHTLDHVIFYNKKNNLLFCGDVIFSLGCGRIFEGTYEQMYSSLQTINSLSDQTLVFCGHEYTLQNYNFLKTVFPKNSLLENYKLKIDKKIKNTNRSIPFSLGDEKIYNPFLVSNKNIYTEFIKSKNFDDFMFFTYLRRLKDSY